MPIEIEGQRYYSTTETCEEVGISRATLSRWLKRGLINELRKDRRGWRLFTDADIQELKTESIRIDVEKI